MEEKRIDNSREKLNSKDEAIKQIDHLLNDFKEHPDIWLSNDEKIAVPEPGGELEKKKHKWSHNKYSVTWWLTPVVGYLDRIIENEIADENKRSRFREELDDLLKHVRSEGMGAISKDTIDKAEKLLKDVRSSII